MIAAKTKSIPARKADVSALVELLPEQGDWRESEYLAWTRDTNKLVEFTNGFVEILAMPTMNHQLIVQFLSSRLHSWVSERNIGRVLFAPLRVRLRPGMIREPDIVFMSNEHAQRMQNECWEGADLVMEIVSRDARSRRRDLETKRRDYVIGGVKEYWIVDPVKKQITVLKLRGKRYIMHGTWSRGQEAESSLIPGFGVKVDDVMNAQMRT